MEIDHAAETSPYMFGPVATKTGSILELAGSLKAPKGKHVAVKDMNTWRGKGKLEQPKELRRRR